MVGSSVPTSNSYSINFKFNWHFKTFFGLERYPQANNQTIGSNGPEGLEEFIASHQSKRLKKSKQGSPTGGSFQEDVSRTASSSLGTGARDLPP